MTVSTITPNVAVTADTTVRTTGDSTSTDKDMFLKLLIAQLQNQDPSSPMDSKDMMASITQMSQVEQQMNQSKSLASLALSQGVTMVGKNIQFTQVNKDSAGHVLNNTTVIGTVDHVTQSNGAVKLAVNVLGTVNTDGSISPATTNATVSVDIDQVTEAG